MKNQGAVALAVFCMLIASVVFARSSYYDAVRAAHVELDENLSIDTENDPSTATKMMTGGNGITRTVISNHKDSAGMACFWAVTGGTSCTTSPKTCNLSSTDGEWLEPGYKVTRSWGPNIDLCVIAPTADTDVQVASDAL